MTFVGIDVSANYLDVAIGPHLHRVPNPEGIPSLLQLLPPSSVVGLEATGVYGRPVACALHRAGHAVYVLNPLMVRSYARSLLTRAKTDKADARLIARFIAERYRELPPYDPTPDVLYQVSLLVRFSRGLSSQRGAVLNRLHAWRYAWPEGLALVADVPLVIGSLHDQVREKALALLRSDPLLWQWYVALQALPGVGPTLALDILAYSGDFRRFKSARAYAAYTGLTPRLYQSGLISEWGAMSRMGPSALRAAYWLAALHAQKVEPYAALVARLLDRGKPRKLALVAVANRLARAAWVVIVKRA